MSFLKFGRIAFLGLALFVAIPKAHAQYSAGGIEQWSAFNPRGSVILPIGSVSARAALPPSNATVAWICNTGDIVAYLALGDETVVADETSFPLMPKSCGALAIAKTQTAGRVITHVAGFENEGGKATLTIIIGTGHP
jgi:hypothetical protein